MNSTNYGVLQGATPLLMKTLASQSDFQIVFEDYQCKPRVDPNNKTMYLPTPPSTYVNDKERVKAFGFLHHESAHLNYSEFFQKGEFRHSIIARLNNIFEDGRIEYLHCKKWPGARKTLSSLVQHLVVDNFFQKPDKLSNQASSMICYLLYRMRAHYLKQDGLLEYSYESKEIFEDLFGKVTRARVDGLISQIFIEGSTSRDMLDLANRAFDIIEELSEEDEEPEQNSSENSSGGPDSNESGDIQEQSSSGTNDSKDDNDDSSNGGSDSCSKDDSNDSSEESPQSGSSGNVADDSLSQKQRENLKSALDTDDIDIPDFLDDISDSLADQVAKDLNNSRNKNKLKTDYALSEIDSTYDEAFTASAYGATCRSTQELKNFLTTGVRRFKRKQVQGPLLDSRNIDRLYTGDPRVFAKKQPTKAVDTSVSILLDLSGSMDGYCDLAATSAYATALALDNIPRLSVQVAGFQYRNDVSILKPFNQPAKSCATAFQLEANGGTPLSQCLFWAMESLISHRSTRNIVLVITDGDPNCSSSTKEAISLLKKAQVETWAIGIGNEAKYVKSFFDNYQLVDSIHELSEKLVKLFKQGFVHSYI